MDALKIENLSFTYPDGRSGLKDVSFTIKKGERLALVGSNGSGKSTLLLHINGLLDGKGNIEVMGMPRSRANMKKIRKSIGYLFSQVDYQFIMPDLRNDILLSIPEHYSGESRLNKCSEWLKQFSLSAYSERSPLELSSGEMKRAALAGVLAREPEILILDEPLSNLDKQSSLQLIEILKGLHHTMVFASHRKILVEKLATKIAVMYNGRLTGIYPAERISEIPEIQNLLF